MDSPWLRALAGNFTAARWRTTGVAAWERTRGGCLERIFRIRRHFSRKNEICVSTTIYIYIYYSCRRDKYVVI